MTLLAAMLACALAPAADLLWSVELESDDGGLLSYGQTAQWEWGTVTSGPEASYDGTACWATQLGGWYLNDSVDHLEIGTLPLSGATRPVLMFQHWYSFESGDAGILELLQGGTWQPVDPIYGYPSGVGYEGSSDDWVPAWVALTGLEDGDALRFTLSADGSGANLGWYVDQIELWDGDPVPPQVEFDGCLEDTEDLVGPYGLEVTAIDDLAVSSVVVAYSVDGQTERRRLFTDEGDGRWIGNLHAQVLGSQISYRIEVNDAENRTVVPSEPCSFEVRLPAPTGLQGPSGVVWDSVAPLTWTPPETANDVLGYRVYRDGVMVLEVEAPPGDAPVVTGDQSFTVTAVYDLGDGSASDPITVQAAVPSVSGLEPTLGYQGDQLRLRVEGEYLLLEQGDLEVDLGDGVSVTEYDVRDVDLAFVTIFVETTAPAGLRDLILWTGEQELVLFEAFTVLSGAERPQLTGVSPDTVRQGDELDLIISASDAFADVPSIWLGEHILVESVEQNAADTLTVGVVVPYDTPLGLQDLEVDDGTRIYSGYRIQVRDFITPVDPGGTCSSTPGRAGLLSLLLALGGALGLRRRRG